MASLKFTEAETAFKVAVADRENGLELFVDRDLPQTVPQAPGRVTMVLDRSRRTHRTSEPSITQ